MSNCASANCFCETPLPGVGGVAVEVIGGLLGVLGVARLPKKADEAGESPATTVPGAEDTGTGLAGVAGDGDAAAALLAALALALAAASALILATLCAVVSGASAITFLLCHNKILWRLIS